MKKTILTRFFSRSQFFLWGLLTFGMLSFSGNAYGQCATVAAGSSLMNPGFENGFDNWTFPLNYNPNSVFIGNTNPNSGASHAVFRHGAGQPQMWQAIPAAEGDVVTGSWEVFVNTPVTGNEFASLQLLFWSGNNQLLSVQDTNVDGGFSTPNGYETVSFTGTAPAGTMRAEIFIIFLDQGPPGSGTLEIFLDDATLTNNSNPSICGSSMMFTVDDACNLPSINFPDLMFDTPAGCTVTSVTNDFNNTNNASGTYPLGTTDVVYTIVDSDGTSNCAFSIEVVDMTPPTVDCGGVFNPSFDLPFGWGLAGGATAFDQGFGSDLPGGSGAPMAVLFNNPAGFGVLFQTGIPSFEGEVITAGYAGFLPGDFTNSGSYAGIKFEFYDENGGLVFDTGDIILWDDQDATGFWEVRTATVTAPAGTATVTLVPLFVGPGSAILIDDIVYETAILVDGDCDPYVVLPELNFSDACGAVSITNDFNGTDNSADFYPEGTTVVTTTAVDGSNNETSCTQTVIVELDGAPCPDPTATITDPCVCLDNATNNTDGQFGELIEVDGFPGDIWTVTASTGLYVVNPNDLNEQAVVGTVYPLFPVTGAQLVEVIPGIFQLAGVHVDAIGYSVTVTNLFTGFQLTIANNCTYPNVTVTDLAASNNACLADGTFDFSVTPNVAGQLDVTVGGAPVFSGAVAANVNNNIVVDVTALGTGDYQIAVNFNANAGGANAPGCAVSYDYSLTVGEPQGTLTCNDNIQVSLDQTCSVTLTPDMVLEGTYTGAFNLAIAGVPGNVLNGSNIGSTYTVTVSDACGVNSCWSMVTVEDKLAPTISCLDVVTVCTADITAVTPPTALDNCDPNPTIQLVDSALGDEDACDDNQVVLVQSFIAIDAQGNQSAPCQRSVVVVRPTADQVNFPDDIVWSCEQYAAHSYIIDATRINPAISNGFGTTYPAFDNTVNSWDLTGIPVNSLLLTQNVVGTNPLRATGSGIPTEIDGIYCQYGYTSADVVLSTCDFAASTDSPVFKIVRTWTVLDWCTGAIVTGNALGEDNVQVIKVIDNTPPLVVGADVTVSANIQGQHPQPCKGQGPILMGTATDNCTGPATNLQGFVYSSLALNSAVAQVTPTGNGFGILNPALPIGAYFVVWSATDACGNSGQSTAYQLNVIDNIVPTAVCDEITQVALSSDGLAVVYAGTFDDGSYDNCCLDRLEVRRMGQTCGINGNTTFDNDGDPQDSPSDPDNGEFVTFCCSDIGNTNMVVLRVFDCSDNYNECMVEVLVEDKLAPIITCPPNASITCDNFADNLLAGFLACQDLTGAAQDVCQSDALTAAGYGTATAFDNCEATITPTVSGFPLNQCGVGTITRSFSAVDPSGNGGTGQAVCTQTISITTVSDWVVEFPANVDLDCETDEADIDFGEPEIFFETCELIATSFEDQIFDIVADACFKITRQWTVINWCVVGDVIDQEPAAIELSEAQLVAVIGFAAADLDGDGDRDTRTFRDSYRGILPTSDNDPDVDTQDGFITYQQVIKVDDTVAPVIDAGFALENQCIITGNNGTNNDFSGCVFSGVLPTPTYDDCILDVNGETEDGEVIDNAVIITARVFDAAGNIVSNSVVVNNLAIGCYTVRYTAIDRCGNTSIDEYDFCVEDCKLPTPYCKDGVVLELMAINDPNNTTFVPMVELWAVDLDLGSFDNCAGAVQLSFSANVNDIGVQYTCDNVGENEVELWVTDASGNQDFCTTFVIIQANQGQCPTDDPQIAGNVATEANADVQDVTVAVNSTTGFGATQTTLADGNFNFAVPANGDYTITPSKDMNPRNGVTTFDLVTISKHILNVESLDSPYKMIAADANNSGTITTLDLVQVRKLILFIDNEFSNNSSWRFVDASYNFPNANNPWAEAFPEIINLNNVTAADLNNNFVAVKIGDVNGSANANQLLGADDRTVTGALTLTAADVALKAGETHTVEVSAANFNNFGYQFTMNFDANALEFVEAGNGLATADNFGYSLLSEGAITASWNESAAVRMAADETVFTMTFVAKTDVQLSDVLSINSRYTTAEAYAANGDVQNVELNFNSTSVAGFELYQNTPNPFQVETVIGFNLAEAGMATLTITDVSGRVLTVIEGDYAKGYSAVTVRDLPSTGVLYYTLATANETVTKKMIATK